MPDAPEKPAAGVQPSSSTNKESASESKPNAAAKTEASKSTEKPKADQKADEKVDDKKEEKKQPVQQEEEEPEQPDDEYDHWYTKAHLRGFPHEIDARFKKDDEQHEYPILTKFLLQQRMRKEFFKPTENMEEQQKEFNDFKATYKEKFRRPTFTRKYYYVVLKNTILIIVLGSTILFCLAMILITVDVMQQKRKTGLESSQNHILDLIKKEYPDVFVNGQRAELYWVFFVVLFSIGSYFTVRLILRGEEAKFDDYMMQCERRYRHCVAVQDMRRFDMDNNFDSTLNHAILAMERSVIKNKRQKKNGDEKKGPRSTNQ